MAEGTELHGATDVGEGSTQTAQQESAGSQRSEAASTAARGQSLGSSASSSAQLSPDIIAAPAAPAEPKEPSRSASAAAADIGFRGAGQDALTLEPHRTSSSPAVRRLAKELGVDIDRVPATGPNGRVVRGAFHHADT